MSEPTDEYLNELEGWKLFVRNGIWFIGNTEENNTGSYEKMRFVIAKAISDRSERHKKHLQWIKTYSHAGWIAIEDCAFTNFGITSEQLKILI